MRKLQKTVTCLTGCMRGHQQQREVEKGRGKKSLYNNVTVIESETQMLSIQDKALVIPHWGNVTAVQKGQTWGEKKRLTVIKHHFLKNRNKHRNKK